MSLPRVPSGVEALDDVTEGGFPKGSLIIVAGNPGAGKTAFASSFACKGINSGEVVIYASLGEPREAFIADVSKHFRLDAEECMRSERMNFLDLTAIREGGAPTIVQSILDRVERTSAHRLVIDSFSAMALAFERKLDTRNILQALLSKVVRTLGCTTVLIDEIPFGDQHVGTSVEEFVADGFIKLSSETLDGRLVRILEIVKLRGTRLAESRLVFSLEGGFRIFPPFQYKQAKEPQAFKAIPDQPGKFSTGSEELDHILGGGYPIGGTVLLEVDRDVPISQSQLIIGQTIRNFLAKNRASIGISSSGIDPKIMKLSTVRLGFAEDMINRRLRLCVLLPSKVSNDPVVVPLGGENISLDNKRITEIEAELTNETKQPLVYVMGYDSAIAVYGMDETMRTAVFDAARVREKGNLGIAVLSPGYGAASMVLSELADVYMRLIKKNGALILYGIKPRTILYAVEADTSRGYATPKLTPIL
jgi:KaiC/GvpD/RAD55 family RecA-like ATPase